MIKSNSFLTIRYILLLAVAILFLSCKTPSENLAGGTSETESPGFISVLAVDAPPQKNKPDKVFIEMREIEILSSDASWMNIAKPNRIIDFLQLINGNSDILGGSFIPPGSYSQIRIKTGENNTIVFGNDKQPLKAPSGEQSGIKIKLPVSIEPGDSIQIILDFDVHHSIVHTQNKYILKPVFKAFLKHQSGIISGTISNNTSQPLPDRLIHIESPEHKTSTYTDSLGKYQAYVPEGIYTLSTEYDDKIDTIRTNIQVGAQDTIFIGK